MIDVNASLGQWPFGRLKHNTPASMVRLMDSLNIDQACVAPLEGLLYSDVQVANRLLHRATRRIRDRLFPFAVINPNFPGWRDDLAECHQQYATNGIRLFPNYHAYKISDDCCVELFAEAQRRNLPVQIAPQLSDVRSHHPSVLVPPADMSDLPNVLNDFPKLRVAVLNVNLSSWAIKESQSWAIKAEGVFLDIAWLDGLACLDELVDIVSIQRVLFGTNSPLMTPLSAIYKLRESSLNSKQRAAITTTNARRFLGRRNATSR